MPILYADAKRKEAHGLTGIFIRARNEDGKFEPTDIAELHRSSLMLFLRQEGEANLWAENCVMIMLNHAPYDEAEANSLIERHRF